MFTQARSDAIIAELRDRIERIGTDLDAPIDPTSPAHPSTDDDADRSRDAVRSHVREGAHANDMEGVIEVPFEADWYGALIDRGVPPERWGELRRAVLGVHIPPPSGSFGAGAGPSANARGWDDYLIEGDDTRLANLPGYRDPDAINAWERLATIDAFARPWPDAARAIDADSLRAIHAHVFGEVFAWAGRDRTVPMGKGKSRFARPAEIAPQLDALFGRIARMLDPERSNMENVGTENLGTDNANTGSAEARAREALIGEGGMALPAALFAERLAPLFAELNAIHPFREGNGRTQRAMMWLVAARAGHRIAWRATTGERMVRASIAASGGTLDELAHLIADCVHASTARPLSVLIEAFGRSYPTAQVHGMVFRSVRANEAIEGRMAIAGAPFAAVIDGATGDVVVGKRDALSDPDAAIGGNVTLMG